MKNDKSKPSKKGFYAALSGTLVVAVCCFTSILVIILGATGLSVFTPYLDFVLFPALALLIVITAISYKRWKKSQDSV